jgi:NIMA (never in mitosis gene a)-related kinase
LEEVNTLQKLSAHPNIIQYKGSFFHEGFLCIVMQYAEVGDLAQFIKSKKQENKYMPERQIWEFSYQIFKAVEFLHSKHVMHRDIKCENVFVMGGQQEIKVGDFGISKTI